MRKEILGLVLALGCVSTVVLAADSYKIDLVHSNVSFSVKHMMVSNVSGSFEKYDGQIMFDDKDLASSKVSVTIDPSSINTRNEKRDGHLKSPDFFDAVKFPAITFVSKKITATNMIGDLTIKGVTKEITVPATISGPVKGMMGSDVIGINATFTLNRQDYGITWNKTLDQGGLAVSNDVLVNISIEADKIAPVENAMVPVAVAEKK
ncbi:MAG: YceI family protein [Candidatus Omnitrophica bacterium]|nr:YceI family protein [Candidatus Omnitrophota bacterium]